MIPERLRIRLRFNAPEPSFQVPAPRDLKKLAFSVNRRYVSLYSVVFSLYAKFVGYGTEGWPISHGSHSNSFRIEASVTLSFICACDQS